MRLACKFASRKQNTHGYHLYVRIVKMEKSEEFHIIKEGYTVVKFKQDVSMLYSPFEGS